MSFRVIPGKKSEALASTSSLSGAEVEEYCLIACAIAQKKVAGGVAWPGQRNLMCGEVEEHQTP